MKASQIHHERKEERRKQAKAFRKKVAAIRLGSGSYVVRSPTYGGSENRSPAVISFAKEAAEVRELYPTTPREMAANNNED